MGTDTKTDVELVEASRRGELQAFGHLVARYQDVVCAVSYSSIGDRSLSEDVAQETFIAAWSQLDRLRDTFRLRPWLCGIARNIARKARKKKRREELGHEPDLAADGTPFDDASRAETERVVRAALARIHSSYREVLVLYYRENQSIREIAHTLGTSEAAVMQKLTRGRRALAERVEQLVETSLRGDRRQRDLVAGVLAAIAVMNVPSRVDASPSKGSTMFKFAIAASTVAVVGTAAYLTHRHYSSSDNHAPAKVAITPPPAPLLRYGANKLGLAHMPTLGPTGAPRSVRSRSIAIADLGYLPTDAEAVVGINLAQMRDTAIWKRFIAPKVMADHELKSLAALCGFDPVASIDSIVIGAKQVSVGMPTGVVIVHGLDRAKATSCFDHHGIPEAEKGGANVTVDSKVVLIAGSSGNGAGFTFVDDETAVLVVSNPAPSQDDVLRVAAGGGTLATTSVYAETLQYVNTDDSLWLMLADGSPMMNIINGFAAAYSPVKLGTFYVAANFGDNLALDAGLRLPNPESVSTLVETIQTRMHESFVRPIIEKYFDQLDVTADGSDLILSLAASADQLGQLLEKDSADSPVKITVN